MISSLITLAVAGTFLWLTLPPSIAFARTIPLQAWAGIQVFIVWPTTLVSIAAMAAMTLLGSFDDKGILSPFSFATWLFALLQRTSTGVLLGIVILAALFAEP